jgi:hypothetical protein
LGKDGVVRVERLTRWRSSGTLWKRMWYALLIGTGLFGVQGSRGRAWHRGRATVAGSV